MTPMTRIRTGIILVMATVVALAPAMMAGPLPNSGFESGTFIDWTLEIPRGRSHHRPRHRPAGSASVVTSWGSQVGLADRFAPEGNYFALLGSLDAGAFRGNETFEIRLGRHLDLNAGDFVSGWAFFFNGDSTPKDAAWVNIYNDQGDLVATPWRENSGSTGWRDGNTTPFLTATPWTLWEWEADDAGCYTVQFGMTTSDDNCDASYGAFDELLITTGPVSVPEPASGVVLLYGMVALAVFRRLARRN